MSTIPIVSVRLPLAPLPSGAVAPSNKYDPAFRDYLRDIGSKIRALRDDRGLNTEEAAERAGMSSGYWGLVERAVKQPSLQSLFFFASALAVDVSDLVCVGRAAPQLLRKSRLRRIVAAIAEAPPAKAKAIEICAKAILALREEDWTEARAGSPSQANGRRNRHRQPRSDG